MNKTYYVYIITYTDNKKYIGYRGCKGSPWEDTKYLGSGTYTPNNKIKSKNILFVCINGQEAFDVETRLLKKVDAKNNPNYYNAHNNTGLKHITEWTEEKRKRIGSLISKACKRPEIKARRSELSLQRWNDPAMVTKIKIARDKIMSSKNYKEKHRINSTNMWKTEEYRNKMKDFQKGKHNSRYDSTWYVLTNTNTNITLVLQKYYIRTFSSDWLNIGRSKCFRLINNTETVFKGWYLCASHKELTTEGPYCIL